MAIPDAFKDLCRHFHQDVLLIHATPQEMIASALRPLGDEQKRIVRQFLDEVLNGHQTSAELQQMWWDTPADIYFPDTESLLAFLRLIHRAVE